MRFCHLPETSYRPRPEPCFPHKNKKTPWANGAWLVASTQGCSLDRSAQAATGQGPVCHWLSLRDHQNCYQLGSAHPPGSKANLLTPGCGEGKYSIYCRCQAGMGSLCSKDSNPHPLGLSGKGFKGNIWGEGCREHDFLLIGWW